MEALQQNFLMSSTLRCHMRDGSGLDLMGVAEKKASWRQTNRRWRKKWRNEWQWVGLGLMWVALFDALPESGRPAGPSLVQLIVLCDPLIMEADQRLIGPLLDGLLCQWSSSESIRWTMRWITWPPLILPSPRISLTNNQCFFVSVPVKFNLLVLYTNFLLSAENCYLNIDSTTCYALLLVILSLISILLQVWHSSHHGIGFNIQESSRDFGGQYSNWLFDTTPGFAVL